MIVGLGGWATAGKDSVADILVEHHGWEKTFMSKALHECMLALDPIVDTFGNRYSLLYSANGYDGAKRNPEVRRLLQCMGTEVGRKILGENVWVDMAFREVDALHLLGHDIAITGIRFPNELDAIRARGGVAVWVDRPGTKPVNAHASEGSLKITAFDKVISNDGTLTDLRLAVWQFLGRR